MPCPPPPLQLSLRVVFGQEVGVLREELEQHHERVKHQEDWFNAENLRLKNRLLQQEGALKKQETKVNDLQVGRSGAFPSARASTSKLANCRQVYIKVNDLQVGRSGAFLSVRASASKLAICR